MTNKIFTWEKTKKAGLALLASAVIGAGVNLYNLVKTPSEIEVPKKNLSETYAILANCSGTTTAERFSEQNHHYSMLNILSAYNLLKQEGLSDENISLFIYNPTEENIFETKEYKSLLEKKALTGILPSKTDKFIIDGKATKENFMNALRKLNLDSKDTLYVVLSNPSPKKIEEPNGINYGTADTYVLLEDEELFSADLASTMNSQRLGDAKKIIILNSGDSNMFLPYLEENVFLDSFFLSKKEKKDLGLKSLLALSSPREGTFDKETFIMNFLNQYNKDKKQPIRELIEKTNGKAYSFCGIKIAPEKNPWFNKPLIDNN